MISLLFFVSACLASVEIGLKAHDEALVSVSFTNTYQQTVTMLVWDTPFDDMSEVFRGNMFKVAKATGEAMKYEGVVMKRYPIVSDFLSLRPGQTIETVVDISRGYDLPQAGVYTVELATRARMTFSEVDIQTVNHEIVATSFDSVLLTSQPIMIKVSSSSPAREWETVPIKSNASQAINFKNCNTGEQDKVNTASTYCDNELAYFLPYLAGIRSDCSNIAEYPLYTEWFGGCTSTFLTTVYTVYSNMQTQKNQKDWGADCGKSGCGGPNTYAYVYPADPSHTIHLCGAFWSASPLNPCSCPGHDIAPGVLVHEFSHFNDIGGTDDYVYGTTKARELAIADPAKATDNADNYEYFAESCPCTSKQQ